MYKPMQFTITRASVTNSVCRSVRRRSYLLAAVALTCFTFSPIVWAVLPAPDGGYANDNTAEGGPTALASLTSGSDNTAIGFQSLNANTTGGGNMAIGSQSLLSNTTGNNNTGNGFE